MNFLPRLKIRSGWSAVSLESSELALGVDEATMDGGLVLVFCDLELGEGNIWW